MNILISDIKFSELSLIDIGRVFVWRDRLFRAIEIESVDHVKTLFECGLVSALINDKLLVDSWITEYQLEGYGLVIEHKRIETISYPREWSFNMLKDAAKLVLKLNKAAIKFGYQTKDCNGYNVLFGDGVPIFVDLGSFIKVDSTRDVLYSYNEFLLSYIYPLKLWATAGHKTGYLAGVRAGGILLAPEAYLRIKYTILRYVNDNKLLHFWTVLNSVRTLSHNNFLRLRSNFSTNTIKLLLIIKKYSLFSKPAEIAYLENALLEITPKKSTTMWSNYHDSIVTNKTTPTSLRFEFITNQLLTLPINSVLELAGNQGALSILIKKQLKNVRVTCTDADAIAIDKGYLHASQAQVEIDWAVINPFSPESSPLELPPDNRLKSDAVLALAITHHLTLSQPFRINYIFKIIKAYSNKFVFIEFMPLGLFNGTKAPETPDWYNEEWFTSEFITHFNLLSRVELEENRILYIGKIK